MGFEFNVRFGAVCVSAGLGETLNMLVSLFGGVLVTAAREGGGAVNTLSGPEGTHWCCL